MSIDDCINRLREPEQHWAVRKDWLYDRADLKESFGRIDGETIQQWLIPCWHVFGSPASPADLDRLQENLQQEELQLALPTGLRRFLEIADGARLYCLTPLWMRPEFPDAQYQRYRIFGSAELLELNRRLLSDFRAMLGDDPEFRDFHKLNYMAFCDAFDGNHLAILLEGPTAGSVFFLNHEYLFRPYSERFSDMYYTIASSFEEWLQMLVDSRGWGGFGEPVPTI